jgi:hypothetical protein
VAFSYFEIKSKSQFPILQVDRSESDASDSETFEDDEGTKDSTDTEAHKTLKQRVCRAVANTKGPLTTPRAVQKKLNNVSTEVVKGRYHEEKIFCNQAFQLHGHLYTLQN